MNNSTIIPIVFSANDKYTPYTGVAISSVIMNCSPNFNYRIYVLNRDITAENVKRLESLGNDYVSVECVNVSEQIKDVCDFHSLHLTQECVYRLLIPELFSQYEKVIYLDSDLIVVDDISKFYQFNIDGFLLGAVHDICNYQMDRHYKENLALPSCMAFNSGVLLMNIPLLIQKNVKNQCIQLLQKDLQQEHPKYIYLDQDVLNIVCRNSVSFLENGWNFQSWHSHPLVQINLFSNYREIYLKSEKQCRIIHYAGPQKPWLYPYLWIPKMREFWGIAKKTRFYQEIQDELECSMGKKWTEPPLCNIKKNSQIILYGAGNRGVELWHILVCSKYCKVVLWVDQNAHKLSRENHNVHHVEEINKVEYDKIVIAIESESVTNTVIKYLQAQGVHREKIVWAYMPKGVDL